MSRTKRPLAEVFYGGLLRLLPADLASIREDALDTFADLYERARQQGLWARTGLMLRLALATVGLAVRARWQGSSVDSMPADRDGGRWALACRDDLRLASRSLQHRPGFSAAVVMVLALGVGAATAIFSVVDCVLLRPMPYPEAQRLVYFDNGSHPGPLFEQWAASARSFDKLGAAMDRTLDLTGDGPPIRLAAAEVSQDFLGVLGGRPAHGRLLDSDDFQTGSRVVVLGPELWQRRFGADPGVVGRTVQLDGEPWTVVGVLDEDFVPPELLVGSRVDAWLPLDFSREQLQQWRYWMLAVVGRLGPGISMSQAQDEVDRFAVAAAEEHPKARRDRQGQPLMVPLVPLREATVDRVQTALLMLLGAVLMMLLVGCANVAGLFLAQGSERRREMALRLALGARRRRLATQLLAESLVLSLLGGALGVALAHGLTALFRSLAPGNLPRLGEVTVDSRVLLAALLAALVTGLVFGLAPALQAAFAPPDGAFRGRGGSSGRRSGRARSVLVVAEVAMALVLLSGAGLLGHSLLRLSQSELGFKASDLVRLQLILGETYDEPRRDRFTRDLLQRLDALPGVESSALGWTVPFDYTGGNRCCWSTGFSLSSDPEAEAVRSLVHPVSPGFLHTLGASMERGRGIGWQDEQSNPVPVVVNETLAQRLFDGAEAMGQVMHTRDGSMQVVGVVADVMHWGATQDKEPTVYAPYFKFGTKFEELSVVVRSSMVASDNLSQALRQVVWDLDPNLPVAGVVALERRISRSLAEPRFYSFLIGAFATLGLLLAAVGLCGTLLYSVTQRRREMGIRLAVGARKGDLLRLVLGQGLTLVAAGLALGLIASLALSDVLASMVHGITARDPLTYGVVCAVLFAVAAASAYLPARKAAGTDPIETLRAE